MAGSTAPEPAAVRCRNIEAAGTSETAAHGANASATRGGTWRLTNVVHVVTKRANGNAYRLVVTWRVATTFAIALSGPYAELR